MSNESSHRVWDSLRVWKQRAAQGLNIATRVSTGRRVARALAGTRLLPPNALQFMHIDRRFTVHIGQDMGTFDYESTDADAVGRHLFWGGLTKWEVESWREFIPMAAAARGFVDVGAFTGCYSLVAASVNPALDALAFEPVPTVYKCLVRNVELNNLTHRVTTVPAAVSTVIGTSRFFIPDRPMPDTSFLESSGRRPEEAGTWHEVATTTLAATLPHGFRVDLMKIDVEDAEGPIVEAMADVLAEHRPAIFIEFLTTGTSERAWDVLRDLGYRLFHLTPEGRIPVDYPRPDDVNLNFLCLPQGR